jgi:hypothetical protein
MPDIEIIDSELRLVAPLRRAGREAAVDYVADALLDERSRLGEGFDLDAAALHELACRQRFSGSRRTRHR